MCEDGKKKTLTIQKSKVVCGVNYPHTSYIWMDLCLEEAKKFLQPIMPTASAHNSTDGHLMENIRSSGFFALVYNSQHICGSLTGPVVPSGENALS